MHPNIFNKQLTKLLALEHNNQVSNLVTFLSLSLTPR